MCYKGCKLIKQLDKWSKDGRRLSLPAEPGL